MTTVINDITVVAPPVIDVAVEGTQGSSGILSLTAEVIDDLGGDPTARAAAAAAQQKADAALPAAGLTATAITNAGGDTVARASAGAAATAASNALSSASSAAIAAATAQSTANDAVTAAAAAKATADAALPEASFTSANIDAVGGDPTARADATLALSRLISVKAAPFNAKGDGTTDDTASVNAAIAFAAAVGANVSGGNTFRPRLYFPQGAYKISALNPILNTNGLDVEGDGMYTTKLLVAATSSPIFQLGSFNTAPTDGFLGSSQNTFFKNLSIFCDDQSSRNGASGTSSGSNTSTTLNIGGAGYTVNRFAGCNLVITGGTGAGQLRVISSNTASQFTVATAWTVTPDATSTFIVSFPGRTGIAIQDNGGGGLRLSRVRIQGFQYGVCQTHGSDFDMFSDVEIRFCDVGMYMGPGTQQFNHTRLDFNSCRIGLVCDAAMQGVVNSATFVLNETDILFEATNTNPTRLGITSTPAQLQKNYDNALRFVDCWFETGAGGVFVPYDQVCSVRFNGTSASTSGVEFIKPQIWSGSGGMPTKVAGTIYSWMQVNQGSYITIDRPMLVAGRIAFIVDNANTGAFPRINIREPYFTSSVNIRGFSRSDQINISMQSPTTETVLTGTLTNAQDPWLIGGCRNLHKQNYNGVANAAASRLFSYQLQRGVYDVVVRADRSDYGGGLIRRMTVVYETSPGAVNVVQQIGTDITYGTGGPTSMTVAVTSAGVLQITPTFAANTNMNVSASATLIQTPAAV